MEAASPTMLKLAHKFKLLKYNKLPYPQQSLRNPKIHLGTRLAFDKHECFSVLSISCAIL